MKKESIVGVRLSEAELAKLRALAERTERSCGGVLRALLRMAHEREGLGLTLRDGFDDREGSDE
ncbi:MAG: ribbon-helix-helix protein, CopG family [Chloroflexi bacterium]|nr:ribbon-helix-helix protein, CopG family [Chloroflexota bacterium]